MRCLASCIPFLVHQVISPDGQSAQDTAQEKQIAANTRVQHQDAFAPAAVSPARCEEQLQEHKEQLEQLEKDEEWDEEEDEEEDEEWEEDETEEDPARTALATLHAVLRAACRLFRDAKNRLARSAVLPSGTHTYGALGHKHVLLYPPRLSPSPPCIRLAVCLNQRVM